MEWNNNLRNSSESKETTTTTPAFYKKTAPDPPPKLASSLTNGRSHSKMDPPKEFGQFSALLAPALLSGKKNEEGETVRSTLSKKVGLFHARKNKLNKQSIEVSKMKGFSFAPASLRGV